MDISRIFAQNQAIAAQLYGSQAGMQGAGINAGGIQPQKTEGAQVAGAGLESEGASKFNWRNLNKFDSYLTTSAPQTGVGKTNEAPVQEAGGVNLFGVQGTQSQAGALQKAGSAQSSLISALNNIDARDIGLNGDRSGFEGQRKLNLIA